MPDSFDKILQQVKTPAYILDESALLRNMAIVEHLKQNTNIKVILATKAFALPTVFPLLAQYLDGTTASGIFEARLGAEEFIAHDTTKTQSAKKEVHVYSPAYEESELNEILPLASHIYFNSVSQLKKFYSVVKSFSGDIVIGLRVNPKLSLVKNNPIYDPSSQFSRFGVMKEELTKDVLALVDCLHFHNLCENLAEDSVALIEHINVNFVFALKQVSSVNFGGGHYITHRDYDIEKLIKALNDFREKFSHLSVTLEPGGALVYNTGYLLAKVEDIITREIQIDNTEERVFKIAILNTSATCHMPDVLEVPYQPEIIGAKIASSQNCVDKNTYLLTGKTCLTGDIIGSYSFCDELRIGDKIIFKDMMQYSFVKNNTFNGMPLPDLAILYKSGEYKLLKRFEYSDFRERLG